MTSVIYIKETDLNEVLLAYLGAYGAHMFALRVLEVLELVGPTSYPTISNLSTSLESLGQGRGF